MVYHLPKTIIYLFFLFISCYLPVNAAVEVKKLNQEMNYLKKYGQEPFLFLPEEENTDSVSTKQAANKKIEKKADPDAILKELEEETGAFKPSPPIYAN